jgi:regulator of nucleoside diphosphate kinase
MKYGSLVLEKNEFLKIKKYQEKNVIIEDYAHKSTLEILSQHMSTAMIFETEDIPFDIIKMNSIVNVIGAFGIRQSFQIVAPNEIDVKQNKISVLSSLGATVIGLAQGDSVNYGLPGNLMSLKIEKVRQPKEIYNTITTKPIINKKIPKELKVY